MKKRVIIKEYKVFMVITAFIAFFQCQRAEKRQTELTIFPTDQFLQVITTDSVILRWDKPKNIVDMISGYELLYRVHGDSEWAMIDKQIDAKDKPWVVVYRNDINSRNSFFDFAVCALFQSGERSRMNCSIDSLSSPDGGWFVRW